MVNEELFVSGFGFKPILHFVQRCHNLVYASFCYCEHVTDAGVELLGTLTSLTSLDLSGCNVQDQGVAALGNNCR